MLKNKNVQKFIIREVILFFILVIVSMSFSFMIFKTYSNTLVESNNKMIQYVTKYHPEMEEELIELLLREEMPENIIEKYGVEDVYIGELKSLKTNIILGNVSLIVFSILIMVLSFLFYIKKEQRSLNKISHSISRVLNNDYSIHLKDYEDGYLSSLNNDVCKIITELKEQRDLLGKEKKYLEETLSDISHQLRTPLTSMYVINDLLETNLSSEKKKEFLSKNRTQLERIEWLVTSLLKLSRLESGSVELNKEEVNVHRLIESAIDPVRINLELKGVSIHNLVDTNLLILVDFNWTKEAFVNIIKNAYEHTPNGGSITIRASSNPLYTSITIADTGCGIDKNQLPFIFDRFYKVNKDSDSIGIGLNMTKRIVQEQLGEISVESKREKGTTFTIKFYKNVI